MEWLEEGYQKRSDGQFAGRQFFKDVALKIKLNTSMPFFNLPSKIPIGLELFQI